MANLKFSTHCHCPAESWRDVVSYEGIYSVSTCGLVRRDKQGLGATVGYILKSRLTRKGYSQVILSGKPLKKFSNVHFLVAGAFLGKRPDGYQINHKDGVKTNNHLSNLEYVTPSQNTKHAYATGLMPSQQGEHNPGAKLTESDVIEIKRRLVNGELQKDIARLFGVTPTNITMINTGRTWSHV